MATERQRETARRNIRRAQAARSGGSRGGGSGKRGFAAMSQEQRSAIARKGGQSRGRQRQMD